MILRNFISPREFTIYMENSLRLEISLRSIDRSEICTEVNFTTPEVMWTLIRSYLTPKWSFTPKWNLKPVWVHFGCHVNVLQVTCFTENKNNAVEKNLRVAINFYKKICLRVITWNKKHLAKYVVPITQAHWRKTFSELVVLEVSKLFLFR